MDLSLAKREIHEALLLHLEITNQGQIVRETGQDRKAAQIHLVGLSGTGYATSPEKGSYMITENGKSALGFPETTK